MRINLGHGYTAIWNGGHYVNYFDPQGIEYTCITFGWEKDKPSFMDAWNAFYSAEMEMF